MQERKYQIRQYADSTLDGMPETTEWVWGCCPAHIKEGLLKSGHIKQTDLARTLLVPSWETREVS